MSPAKFPLALDPRLLPNEDIPSLYVLCTNLHSTYHVNYAGEKNKNTVDNNYIVSQGPTGLQYSLKYFKTFYEKKIHP